MKWLSAKSAKPRTGTHCPPWTIPGLFSESYSLSVSRSFSMPVPRGPFSIHLVYPPTRMGFGFIKTKLRLLKKPVIQLPSFRILG